MGYLDTGHIIFDVGEVYDEEQGHGEIVSEIASCK